MRLRKEELIYIGHTITKHGIKPNDCRIKSIINMASPTSITELKRFLGMLNYLSKFLPNISDETKVLRDLEKKGVQW